MIKTDLSGIEKFVGKDELEQTASVLSAHELLEGRNGPGSEYTGWLRLPENYDKNEFSRIRAAANRIRTDSSALVVIGIGGSYLGARAAIELLRSPNYNLLEKDTPDIYFAGNNLSGDYLSEIMRLVQNRDFSVNVISKSGTTTESAIAFRLFKKLLEDKYGIEEARRRIYATTDKSKGALHNMAEEEGYESFAVPDDIGGRYSVLSAVGLLPIACAGIDIGEIMEGAAWAMREFSEKSMDNPVWQYALARQLLYQKGKNVEILACYEPSFRFMGEWWKQLFGESEGKDNGGIFPASVELTADLHSMGQYIQDGGRFLQETVVSFEKPGSEIAVPFDDGDADGLNYLSGKSLHYINSQAIKATKAAHIKGGVPNIEIKVSELSEKSLGALIYFFELACGISGYIQGVNPFDQPGVEEYKKNMFALLGKPGY